MTNTPEYELLCSNLNLPPVVIAVGDVDRHDEVLAELRGVDPDIVYPGGYEITPTRALAASINRRRGPVLEAADGYPFASALHQAWAPGLVRAVRDGGLSLRRAGFGVAASAIMPEQASSIDTISDLSPQLGDVPSVVFADQRTSDGRLVDFGRYGLRHTGAQISPEVVAACTPTGGYRELHDSMWQRGIRGVVVDPHHMLRAAAADADQRIDPWQMLEDIEATGTNVVRIHVSAGREDTAHEADRQRSRQELDALLTGPEALQRTATGEMILAAYAIWQRQRAKPHLPMGRLQEAQYRDELHAEIPRLPVTVEVPYAGLKQLWRGRLSRADFVSLHQDMAYALNAFLRDA